MKLRDYKIENDGIWIAKSELESWRAHYVDVARSLSHNTDSTANDLMWLNIGKSDVLTDILKKFE